MLTTLPAFAEYSAQTAKHAAQSKRAQPAHASAAKKTEAKQEVHTCTRDVAMQTVHEDEDGFVLV